MSRRRIAVESNSMPMAVALAAIETSGPGDLLMGTVKPRKAEAAD